MELRINDYVRTEKGILKIRDDKPFKDDKNKLNYLTYGNYTCVLKENILKSSPNIIDLIEVGDYVNGHKVLETNLKLKWYNDDYEEMDEYQGILLEEEGYMYPSSDVDYGDISIVTKEQFESIQYKVVD